MSVKEIRIGSKNNFSGLPATKATITIITIIITIFVKNYYSGLPATKATTWSDRLRLSVVMAAGSGSKTQTDP